LIVGLLTIVAAPASAEKHPVTVFVATWFRQGPEAYMNIILTDGRVSAGAARNRNTPTARLWTMRCDCGGLESGTYYGTLDKDKIEVEMQTMSGKQRRQSFKVYAHEWVKPLR